MSVRALHHRPFQFHHTTRQRSRSSPPKGASRQDWQASRMPQRNAYGDVVAFTISLCLCFTVCIALLRVWIRRNAYGSDDIVIGVATLVSLGHTGSSYAALSAGLGGKWSTISSEGSNLAQLNQVCGQCVLLHAHTDSRHRRRQRELCYSSWRCTCPSARCCPFLFESPRRASRLCFIRYAPEVSESSACYRSSSPQLDVQRVRVRPITGLSGQILGHVQLW